MKDSNSFFLNVELVGFGTKQIKEMKLDSWMNFTNMSLVEYLVFVQIYADSKKIVLNLID